MRPLVYFSVNTSWYLYNFRKSSIQATQATGDVRHSLADISKAAMLLGYAPTHRLREGLAEAVDWYIHNA